METLSLEQAKALGNQFAKELQEEFKVELDWWFVGSIREGKYNAGTSDIDMVIIPKKEGMFGYEAIKRILAKMEEYKKFGTVFKKGREISLIDVLIIFDLEFVNKLREMNEQSRNRLHTQSE
jgi:hypothetical protein